MTTLYRPAQPDDEPFILSGWSSSMRLSRDVPFIQMDGYADVMHPIIRSVLARPRVTTIVAHGELLRGFITVERSRVGLAPLVMYVYVAQPYRKGGIATGLFEAAGIKPHSRFEYACRTKMSWQLRDKAPFARYNPFRARFAEEEEARDEEGPRIEYRRSSGRRHAG